MTTTAAMKISASASDMRHMVRRLYVDSLPPDLFHQCRRSSTSRQQQKGRERLNGAGLMQTRRALTRTTRHLIRFPGPSGRVTLRGGPRDGGLSAYLQFSFL
jgi:hypothetical protein